MTITKHTAMDIALAYREVETGEALLKEIEEAIDHQAVPEMRDAFGRLQGGLQLGVPHGSGHRLFNVPWQLAKPVVEAHIAACRAKISILAEAARAELSATPSLPTPTEKEQR